MAQAKKAVKAKKKSVRKTANKTKKKAVKKVAKKTVRKTKKKTAKKATKISRIKNAPEEQCFFMVNGQKLKNYEELAKVLGRIEENVFRHHVNDQKNDFVNWIRDVFKDIALAKKIAGIQDKDKLQLVIYRHIMRH